MAKPFLLEFSPGIQRDGTQFDATRYLDGLWCRWRLGRPRKMGGFKEITDKLYAVPRKIHCFYQNGLAYVHFGSSSGIQQIVLDSLGNVLSIQDRTPATFVGGADVGFTMDAIFDTTSSVVQIVVHAVADVIVASTNTKTTPFIGQIDAPDVLLPFSDPSAPGPAIYVQPSISGGIVCVQPFVFSFDSFGRVQWSAPNLPNYLGVTGGSTGAGQARISAQKVVAGAPIRGGGTQSPAAIFWTISEVITAVYVGTPAWFSFNTISSSSSILGTDVVIEYDGLYFWAAVGRFMVFNGTVVEIPNTQNQDWFFNNLTPGLEAKTFAFKVPAYGEIWWCAAMFGNIEPSHAVIYNLRENCWYDTVLPNGGRSAGYFAQGFKYPIMGGCVASPDGNGYRLWLHEYGVDQIDDQGLHAVRSYFETGFFGGPKNSPPDDHGLSFHQLEPDFIQSGDLITYLIGAANARAPTVASDPIPVVFQPAVPQEQMASYTPRQSFRLIQLHVESNVVGGNYICGKNIGHGDAADARIFS